MDGFELSVKRFDEFASEYDERFNNIDAYLEHLDKFCGFVNKENPKILELACGPGNVTKYLKQKFPNSEIIAIDLAPGMIDIAKGYLSDVNFRVMDVRDILTIDSKFDSIMCSFCLPFLSKEDTYKLIADCSTLLNKDGVLYLSTMEGEETKAGFEPTSFSGEAEVYFNYHLEMYITEVLTENKFLIELNKKQEYIEPNGNVTIDMIFIARKIG